MAKTTEISKENWKWDVQNAAGTIIENQRFKKRMKTDKKFKQAVLEELARRLEETQKAVADTKEAIKKT